MALRRIKSWFTSSFLGWQEVYSVVNAEGPVDLYDITVEPSHEFLVKSNNSWLRTHNCIIDDPHSEQEAKTGNAKIYLPAQEWYMAGPRQRLQPGGAIVIVMCMTGDTNVLMSNGLEKKLRNIQQGDEVATYDDGRLSTSVVNNWQSSGVDSIYKIQTQSGIILRANARHPFLVDNHGELEWIELQNLTPGDMLVSLKAVLGHRGPQRSVANAAHANQLTATTGKIQKLHTEVLDITANGKESSAPMKAVKKQPQPKEFAGSITGRKDGQRATTGRLQKQGGHLASSTAMGLLRKISTEWFNSSAGDVLSVMSLPQKQTPALIGQESYASTIATTAGGSEHSSAMTATSPLDIQKQKKQLQQYLNTSDFTTDEIVEIVPDGKEEVFDVEIDRTGNFIANGVVSHNTRWHKKDLTGYVLDVQEKNEGSDEWEVLQFPAIMPSGKSMWPEYWEIEELEKIKATTSIGLWNGPYQQDPVAEEGAIVKREWWKVWEESRPPPVEYIIQSWDTAFLKTETSDFCACTTWGTFLREDEDGVLRTNIILLNAINQRMEFPQLKKEALKEYRQFNPDSLIVEAKASGWPLIQELRAIGVPVVEYSPGRGSDKVARVNAISDIFATGHVWYQPNRWSEEVVEQMASFPNGDYDDLVDSTTQALLRFRRGGLIRIINDEDIPKPKRRIAKYY